MLLHLPLYLTCLIKEQPECVVSYFGNQKKDNKTLELQLVCGLFHNQGTHLSLTGGQKYTCQNVFDFCTHFKQTVWRNYPENFRACGSLVPEL